MDVPAFITSIEKIKGNIPLAVEGGLNRVAEIVLQAKLQAENETYLRPIPTRAEYRDYEAQVGHGNGPLQEKENAAHDRWHRENKDTLGTPKAGLSDEDNEPCWERSGNWKSGQRIESRPGERVVATEGPATEYEERLSNLSKCKFPSLGIDRSNPAAARALQLSAPQIGPAFDQELNNVLLDPDFQSKPLDVQKVYVEHAESIERDRKAKGGL